MVSVLKTGFVLTPVWMRTVLVFPVPARSVLVCWKDAVPVYSQMPAGWLHSAFLLPVLLLPDGFPVDAVPACSPVDGFLAGAVPDVRCSCVHHSWNSADGIPARYFSSSVLRPLPPSHLLQVSPLPALLPGQHFPYVLCGYYPPPHRPKNSYGFSPQRSSLLKYPSVLYFPSPAL